MSWEKRRNEAAAKMCEEQSYRYHFFKRGADWARADLLKDAEEILIDGLVRVDGMCDVGPRCACGRPNGLTAVVGCVRRVIATWRERTGR